MIDKFVNPKDIHNPFYYCITESDFAHREAEARVVHVLAVVSNCGTIVFNLVWVIRMPTEVISIVARNWIARKVIFVYFLVCRLPGARLKH